MVSDNPHGFWFNDYRHEIDFHALQDYENPIEFLLQTGLTDFAINFRENVIATAQIIGWDWHSQEDLEPLPPLPIEEYVAPLDSIVPSLFELCIVNVRKYCGDVENLKKLEIPTPLLNTLKNPLKISYKY